MNAQYPPNPQYPPQQPNYGPPPQPQQPGYAQPQQPQPQQGYGQGYSQPQPLKPEIPHENVWRIKAQVVPTQKMPSGFEIGATATGSPRLAIALAMRKTFQSQGQTKQSEQRVMAYIYGREKEQIAAMLRPGAIVEVGGECNVRRWQDKRNGQWQTSVSIQVGRGANGPDIVVIGDAPLADQPYQQQAPQQGYPQGYPQPPVQQGYPQPQPQPQMPNYPQPQQPQMPPPPQQAAPMPPQGYQQPQVPQMPQPQQPQPQQQMPQQGYPATPPQAGGPGYSGMRPSM